MPVIESVIQEGNQIFHFSEGAMATKYDEWAHYRNQFGKSYQGIKAVDILCVKDSIAWIIEIKDYRQDCQITPSELAEVVAYKVRDTLAGLVSAKFNANDSDEKLMAKNVLKCKKLRVVLHMEQPEGVSKLRPKAIDPAVVLQKLKLLVKSIDAHPCVVDQNSLRPEMEWTVTG